MWCDYVIRAAVQGLSSGKELLPLPAHKFGPHDIVAVRPSKGDASGGSPLAQGEAWNKIGISIKWKRNGWRHV